LHTFIMSRPLPDAHKNLFEFHFSRRTPNKNRPPKGCIPRLWKGRPLGKKSRITGAIAKRTSPDHRPTTATQQNTANFWAGCIQANGRPHILAGGWERLPQGANSCSGILIIGAKPVSSANAAFGRANKLD
jgi:hypothetical protein